MRTAVFISAVVALVGVAAPTPVHAAHRAVGIDVSQWQGNMNWNTAYDQGVRFTFVRASRGGTPAGPNSVGSLVDTQFSSNVTKLRNLAVNDGRTIYNGFYHFSRPDLITINDGNNGNNNNDPNRFNSQPSLSAILSSARDEAQHFYNTIGTHLSAAGPDASRRLRPVLDLERFGGPTSSTDVGLDPGTDRLTPANVTTWALTFLDHFEDLSGGIRPLVYMSSSPAGTHVTSGLSGEDFWVANWNTTTYGNPVTGTGNPPTGVFGDWSFWQFSGDNNTLGATYGAQSTAIDLDVANGELNFVRSFLIPEPVFAPLLAGTTLLLSRRLRR